MAALIQRARRNFAGLPDRGHSESVSGFSVPNGELEVITGCISAGRARTGSPAASKQPKREAYTP